MCGIAGFLYDEREPPVDIIERQLRLLDHRGPDSYGYFTGRGAIIGQTRLAVIDLLTGDPPIANETGSVGACLNGEIYNFKELRAGLERNGHELKTMGDTEVIAHLAEDLEPVELARSLEGMFACAVWDDSQTRLVLVRDRLGKKPLYYWSSGGSFVFASEIKALLDHPLVPRDLEERALDAYLTFGYVPTPHTFFSGIKSVRPGHALVVDAGHPPREIPYWEPEVPGAFPAEPLELSLEEAARHTRSLIEKGVSRRLISDVPLGAFLSGGVDSSTVVGVMSSLSSERVRTFSIGFEDDDGYDERPYARKVAERFDTDHTEFVVKADALALVEQLVWHHDQPFGDSSAIPTYLLSRMTRQGVTVALSGDGGDELFAGYERFGAALAVDAYRRLPQVMTSGARAVLGRLPTRALAGRVGSVQRFTERADMGLPTAFMSWLSYVSEDARKKLLPSGSDWAVEDYEDVWQESEGADLLDRLLHLNLRTYLLDDLLVKVDRMSMAHALEVRCPLLDRELTEFALRLPRSARVRGFTLKRVLRAAVADLLPSDIRGRRKRGFGVPLDRWFRTDLKPYVEGMLATPGARVRRHLVGSEVDVLLAEHAARTRDHGHALWALLTLEVFLRKEDW